MKRFIVFLLTLLVIITAVSARDIEEHSVTDMDSWQESFDISKKKAGKYNIVVTVNDIGGNQTLAGPYNIFIDPDSDLPVVGITNPLNDMRVPGNLNIVGTCVDDDGVDHVELIFDGDKENSKTANGKEFWSYYLDTTQLTEGPHTIQVTGTDINGLAGKSVTVTWHLDRRQPLTSVTNYGMGQLVHDKVTLKGTISDGNGIQELYYSTDDGKNFEEIKIKEDKKKSDWTFENTIDTKKFKDGPAVVWFKAKDKQGSWGIYSFLYFIDNTNPDVKIVYPTEKITENGKFTVAGYAKDVVGMKSLSWAFGDKTGKFDLIPGNPYWTQEFDTTKMKGKDITFTVTGTDTAGNVTEKKLKIPLDQEKDKPIVTISAPANGTVLDGDELYVRGIASDDDKVANVTYSVDGGKGTTQETKGVFYADIPHDGIFAVGEHTVTVYATDINGVKGNPVIAKWTSRGALPVFSNPDIKAGKNTVPVTYGISVHPESGSVYETEASCPCGIKSVHSTIEWGAGQTKEFKFDPKKPQEKVPVSIPLTDTPWGIIKITVTATDIYGRTTDLKSLLDITDLEAVQTETPTVVFDDSTVSADGEIVLNPKMPASGYFIGGTAVKVELVPETSFASAELDGNTIVLNQTDKEGTSDSIVVRVTTDQGLTFDSKALVFKSSGDSSSIDAYIKSVNKESYRSGMPVVLSSDPKSKNQKILTVDITSKEEVKSVSYTITGTKAPGGTQLQTGKATLSKAVKGSTHRTATVPLSDLPAGITKIALEITAGKTTVRKISGTVIVVRKKDASQIDNEKKVYWSEDSSIKYDPSAKIYHLKAGESISGYANMALPVTAEIEGNPEGLSVEVTEHTIALKAEKDNSFSDVVVKVTDGNGIDYEAAPVSLMVDSNNPVVVISEPALFQWIKTAVTIQGTATDENGIQGVDYSIDEGKTWTACSVTPSDENALGMTWKVDLNTSSLPDGLLSIDVKASDKTGHETIVRTAVQKDTAAPETQILVPADGDTINGETRIVMLVKDAGSLEKAVYIKPPAQSASSPETETSEKTTELQPAADTETGTEARQPIEIPISSSVTTLVGTKDEPLEESMAFEFTDAAGNTTKIQSWPFLIDKESDLPRVEIHLPSKNEIITRDFVISGVVYDDDGACKIWYKIDDNEYQALPDSGTSFSINIPLSTMTDNEHTVTVYAEDIHGVKGLETSCPFRISLEEPKGSVLEPTIDATVKNLITMKGTASDKNGISKVQISLDNGNSYNDATGTEDWAYTFDTRAIQGGTHVVFLKIFDGYEIQGLYSSLINIDNTKPEITLDLPLDDSKTTGSVFFSGYSSDNIGITSLDIVIRSLDGKTVDEKLQKVDLVPDKIVAKTLDISALEDGFYNVELSGTDAAGNVTRVSRNIQLDKTAPVAKVDLLYPLNSEHKQGEFNIYGTATSEKPVNDLLLYIDGTQISNTTLSSAGYFKFNIKTGSITEGTHVYKVEARLNDGTVIDSKEQTVIYTPVGPWVTIDNFTYGDFAINRPYITGKAGYAISEDELLAAKQKKATKEQQKTVANKSVRKVEISFDNGKTFTQVSKKGKWTYRIENEDIEEGFHFLLVRATMKNGETAITRTIVQVDKTKPYVRLISPGEGGRYNQELKFSGLSSDTVGLKNVTLALRKGDKSSYEVPEFIQGLYIDWHFWGATLFDIGVGLTFFDDNVKLQAQWGQFTQAQRNMFTSTDMRYGGNNVFGLKILANVGAVPFRYFFGPDWDWLSAAFTVGANFTYFNETNSGTPQVLSAILGQIEFPRISMKKFVPNMKYFSTVSLYTEFQLWFIPTDVNSDDIQNRVFQISEGIRMNVF